MALKERKDIRTHKIAKLSLGETHRPTSIVQNRNEYYKENKLGMMRWRDW